MKNTLVLWVCLLIPGLCLAQGRKDIREAGIKSATVYKYDYKTGKEVKTLDSKSTYDANGNEIEVYEYDDFGKVTKHEKYTYNASNDKVSETIYDAAGKVKKVINSTYDSNRKKTMESEYDAAGNLKKVSKFTYYGEFKTEKQTFDATNKLIQKKVYTYGK